MRLSFHLIGKLSILCCCASGLLRAQANVTTYHNDIARTGLYGEETTLTPTNVNSSQFGKLFSAPVDGSVFAQPLYMSGVTIAGGTHNVLYVATQHDSVYAIDADSGSVYLRVSLLPSGGRTVIDADFGGCNDITPEVGITGTPVIDPATGTLYVVAKSKVNGGFVQYLHALDISTFAEKMRGPVMIQATVPGKGYDGNGTSLSFNPLEENQRAALLLENGHVVIAWAGHCDGDPYHGWVMSYGASTLSQEAVFNPSANGERGGVWMSGGGIAADANGNIYFATGNGSWNGSSDFGDSIVKMGPPVSGNWPVIDYFTAYNQATLDHDDTDLGSGGLVLLPTLASGQQLLAQQGKEGTIYLIDRNNMGKYCIKSTPACSGADTQIVQEIKGASTGVWGSPAYWNGNLYWTGANDHIRAYSFNANNSGLISKVSTSASAETFAFTAPTPSISASGNSNAILWALDGSSENSTCIAGVNCLGLYAYDATNLGRVLYKSSQAANNRDSPGSAVKFAPPVIINGRVYVGAQGAVSAYGLFTTPLAPSLSPTPGSYGSPQAVALSDSTPAAVIHYTTNGSVPTASSAVYNPGFPLQISTTTTLQAIAVANGYGNSAVSGGTYTITGQGTAPVQVGLAAVENVTGIGSNGSPVMNGGLDGSGDAYSQNLTGTQVTWSGATFALGNTGASNAVSEATIALPAGNDSTVKLLATGLHGNQTNQTFLVTYADGTTTSFTQSLSDWHTPQNYAGESQALAMAYRLTSSGAIDNRAFYLYGYSFAIDSAKTVRSITLPHNRNVVVLAVDVTPSSATPVAASPSLNPAPGSYGSAQSVSLSDATPGAVIHYTTNGAAPTASSAVFNTGTPLQISKTTTVQAIAVASGYTNSASSGGTYTITAQGTTVEVALSAVDNVAGIGSNGSPVINGGLDGGGDAYSQNLTGTSVTWSGATFALGDAGALNAVSGATIALPSGNYSTVKLLATGLHGNQSAQPFLVSYTDGTSTSITQSLSDWHTPQSYAGESQALTMAYRLTVNGGLDNRTFYLYGYSLPIDGTRTVRRITLPQNRNVVVLAVDLSP